MDKDAPAACSLGSDALGRRLDAIAEVGANSLISSEIADDRHLLRFRANSETRKQLKAIVAAEAECCSVLDLQLSEEGNELHLFVSAPERARALAAGLAAAFAQKAISRKPKRPASGLSDREAEI